MLILIGGNYNKIILTEHKDILATKVFLFELLYECLISNNILFSIFEEELEALTISK